jgi:hypothetical protein
VEFKASVGVLLFLLSHFILSQYHHLFLAAMRNYTDFIDAVTPEDPTKRGGLKSEFTKHFVPNSVEPNVFSSRGEL